MSYLNPAVVIKPASIIMWCVARLMKVDWTRRLVSVADSAKIDRESNYANASRCFSNHEERTINIIVVEHAAIKTPANDSQPKSVQRSIQTSILYTLIVYNTIFFRAVRLFVRLSVCHNRVLCAKSKVKRLPRYLHCIVALLQ